MTTAASSRLRSVLFHALRSAFRVLPINETTRDRLRQQFLDLFPTIRPASLRGQSGTSRARRPYLHSGAPALGHVEHSIEPLPDPLPATLVAFYLPQFHTIPENDEWWGKGFTEWRNVARALPQFEGHAQPRLPGDLGFYDLRNPQVMRDQAKLAREYGISAFCFYFYWFGGKTLLEEPLRQWLNDPSIDFSFCLCWANENWSRRWDGRSEDILVAQSHSIEDDLAFIAYIAPYLRDPRYLRIDGKPLLVVYRPGLLPDAAATATRWREWCRSNDIGEVTIAYVQSFERPNPRDIGFDAAIEFPPNLSAPPDITSRQMLINNGYAGQVLDWRKVAEEYSRRPLPSYPLFPGVNCGWDNEPRRPGRGRTYLHSSPREYGRWLLNTIETRLAPSPPESRLVFINAWNEWAEGAVLEPDAAHGYAWLHETRRALTGRVTGRGLPRDSRRPCAVIHAWYPDALDDVLARLGSCDFNWRVIITTTAEKVAAVRTCLLQKRMEAEVVVVPNHGRDILPFLQVANRLLNEGEDIVLKVHTKRSVHRTDGDIWRAEILERLIPANQTRRIVSRMREEERLGLVGPAGHLLPLDQFLGDNAEAIAHLVARLGLETPPEDTEFVAGSMFWTRLDALKPVLNANLSPDDFEPENGQTDGTMAHGIERLLAAVVAQEGWRVTDTAELLGLQAPGGEFRYARRD